MKVKFSKSQWEAIGHSAGWMRTAIVPSLAPPGIKNQPVKAPPTAFQTPNTQKTNPNPLTQNDSKTRKEVSDFIRWLGPKVNDDTLKKMIQQDQGARRGVLEFTEALTNVPIAKSKEIVQKTEEVKNALEEEQGKSVDDQGKPDPESVGKKAGNDLKIKLSKTQWWKIGRKTGWIQAQYDKKIYDPQLTTDEAKKLWFAISDYMIMASDPQYETIRKIKRMITKLKDPRDMEEMKKYFISEFGGSHTVKTGVWEYYE